MGHNRAFGFGAITAESNPIGREELIDIIRALDGIVLPPGVAVGINAIRSEECKTGEPGVYAIVHLNFAGRGGITGRRITLDIAVHAAPDEESMGRLNEAVDLAFKY